MKKLFTLLLVICLLAGCTGKNDKLLNHEESSSSKGFTASEEKRIDDAIDSFNQLIEDAEERTKSKPIYSDTIVLGNITIENNVADKVTVTGKVTGKDKSAVDTSNLQRQMSIEIRAIDIIEAYIAWYATAYDGTGNAVGSSSGNNSATEISGNISIKVDTHEDIDIDNVKVQIWDNNIPSDANSLTLTAVKNDTKYKTHVLYFLSERTAFAEERPVPVLTAYGSDGAVLYKAVGEKHNSSNTSGVSNKVMYKVHTASKHADKVTRYEITSDTASITASDGVDGLLEELNISIVQPGE